MAKAKKPGYYTAEDLERLLKLKLQLFLRAVAFAGALLIFATYHSEIMKGPRESLGIQESYFTALVTVLLVAITAAVIDFPIRLAYRRIRKRFSKKRR